MEKGAPLSPARPGGFGGKQDQSHYCTEQPCRHMRSVGQEIDDLGGLALTNKISVTQLNISRGWVPRAGHVRPVSDLSLQ